MIQEETISAIVTPVGTAGVGIIRLSGKNSIKIVDRIFFALNCKKLFECEDRKVVFGHIKNFNGEIIDEALVIVMRSPKSYTKEDVVEIQCHGNNIVLREILRLTFEAGAKPAERGEFTKRAFLNGRIDLSQAQAVLDVIQAKTTTGLISAQKRLSGNISKNVQEIRQTILHSLAHIEAVIDFPEEKISNLILSEISENIIEQIGKLEKLFTDQVHNKILREGIEIVIIGKPNVGKSSLLNFLTKKERAIVTDIPGTTRDCIEEFINIGGIPIKIIDTAGIRYSVDMIERIGIERAKSYVQQAELILGVFDSSSPLTSEDEEIFKLLRSKTFLILLTKLDLPQLTTTKQILEKIPTAQVIEISLKNGSGVNKLLNEISFKLEKMTFEQNFVRDERELDLIRRTINHLRESEKTIERQIGIDFISIDLRAALECLSELTGETVTEDVIDEIFSKFCVGK